MARLVYDPNTGMMKPDVDDPLGNGTQGTTTDQGAPPPIVPPAPPTPDPGPVAAAPTVGPAPGISPWTREFAPPAQRGFTPLPGFTPPPAFRAPSAEDALNDEGYKFVLSQGEQALNAAASAKGTLNDSSTLKAFTDYGQKAASGQYAQVYNRSADTYDRNYRDQYLDPYSASVAGVKDSNAWNQHANDADFQNAMAQFNGEYNIWRDKNVTIPQQLA